jgi:hypothetical protein
MYGLIGKEGLAHTWLIAGNKLRVNSVPRRAECVRVTVT